MIVIDDRKIDDKKRERLKMIKISRKAESKVIILQSGEKKNNLLRK